MKKFLLMLGCVSLVVAPVLHGEEKANHAAKPTHTTGDADHVMVRPDAIQWGAPPPGLPPGAQTAVLAGDPKKQGPFVMRAKFPDGYKVPPHWHSVAENITVLHGTLMMGSGEKIDPSKMKELPAGSFSHMSKEMRHYVLAKGETIVQVHGDGPFDITYVNPADDPRKKEAKD